MFACKNQDVSSYQSMATKSSPSSVMSSCLKLMQLFQPLTKTIIPTRENVDNQEEDYDVTHLINQAAQHPSDQQTRKT